MTKKKLRGFEEVIEQHRHHGKTVSAHGKSILLHPTITLPKRNDEGSAGYDFYTPVDVELHPGEKKIVFTNVKAYMQPDEVLLLFPRSSMGIKQGLMLSNTAGVIDASYYENPTNDGNIGLPLLNTSGRTIKLPAGEHIVQGIFIKYLNADNDEVVNDKRDSASGVIG